MNITPDQVGTLISAGVAAGQLVTNIISMIRGSSLSAEEKAAAIAKIRAELHDGEVTADAAHVRQVDDANRG